MLPLLDVLFVTASLSLGFGASLATYRFFAWRNDWPMGELHAKRPFIPVMLGGFAIVISLLFASERQYEAARVLGSHYDGLWIVFSGTAWAFLLIGIMRVGAQISLFLAPLATLILIVAWVLARTPPRYISEGGFIPHTSVVRLPLLERTLQHRTIKLCFVQNFITDPEERMAD